MYLAGRPTNRNRPQQDGEPSANPCSQPHGSNGIPCSEPLALRMITAQEFRNTYYGDDEEHRNVTDAYASDDEIR